eukprot:144818_1
MDDFGNAVKKKPKHKKSVKKSTVDDFDAEWDSIPTKVYEPPKEPTPPPQPEPTPPPKKKKKKKKSKRTRSPSKSLPQNENDTDKEKENTCEGDENSSDVNNVNHTLSGIIGMGITDLAIHDIDDTKAKGSADVIVIDSE